jgi:N-acylneuraminate cytidylyltransferase
LDSDADIVIAVKPAERSPYFNMVVLDDTASARLVISSDKIIRRRQDAPRVYDVTTVAYAARPAYVLRASSVFEGKVKAVLVPAERAVDIDTELDFKFVEFLLTQVSNQDHT